LSVYADTNFAASLYMPDANSARAAQRMRRVRLPLLMGSLGELELTNAFRLRVFRGEMRAAEARTALAAFHDDLHHGIVAVSPMPDSIYVQAERLATRWTARLGTRTLDILHVACALALGAESFYTFDDRQRRLASAAGLRIT
jgi:predicted nucleic acid-binding protein